MNLTAGLYVDIMAVGDFMSFDQQKYIDDYKKQKYDRITIFVNKGTKNEWKAAADNAGLSLSQYIVRAMDQYMEK